MDDNYLSHEHLFAIELAKKRIFYTSLLKAISYRYTKILFLYLISLLSLPVNALEDDLDALALLYGDEETVSIATGSSKAIHLAPSVATVITSSDIEAMGANDLDDVLQSVPGMHVYLLQRWSSGYSVRGIQTKTNPQLLMLLNGFPLTESYTGSRPPKYFLPIHSIERIEIIRGPGSAVYGADAFSGVINIITKTSDDIDQVSVGVVTGSFDTKGLWLEGKYNLANWKGSYVLEYEKSDGDKSREVPFDLQAVLDGFFATNASLAPGHASTNYEVVNGNFHLHNNRWQMGYNYWEQSDAGIGVGVSEALDPTATQNTRLHLFDIGYQNTDLLDNWRFDVNANYLHLKQRSFYTIFPPNAVLPIGADGNLDFASPNFVSFPDGYIGSPGGTDKIYSTELVAFYTGLTKHSFRFASGYKKANFSAVETKNFGPGVIDGTQPVVDGTLTDVTGTPFSFLEDTDRNIRYLSLQDEIKLFSDWDLTAGVRYDDYSDFGDTVNWRAALVWQTNYNLTTKFLYGQAFRAPSFSELSTINNPIVLGNPNLDPEKINTWEISFDYRPSYDLTLNLNLYTYEIEDLIDFIPDQGAATSTAQNAIEQEGKGFEIEAYWTISEKLKLSGSFSKQKSESGPSNNAVADAPQTLASVDLRWTISQQWHASAQLHHVADRKRAAGDTRSAVNDYSLLNLVLFTDELFDRWDLKVSAYNILGKEAYEPGAASVPIDHRLQGRSVLLDLEYRLE